MERGGAFVLLLAILFLFTSVGPSEAPSLTVTLEPGEPKWVGLTLRGGAMLQVLIEGRPDSVIRLVVFDPNSDVLVNSTFVGSMKFVIPIRSSGVHIFGLYPVSLDSTMEVRIDYDSTQASVRGGIPFTVLLLLTGIVMLSSAMFVYILLESRRTRAGDGTMSDSSDEW